MNAFRLAFAPSPACGRRWPREARPDEGVRVVAPSPRPSPASGRGGDCAAVIAAAFLCAAGAADAAEAERDTCRDFDLATRLPPSFQDDASALLPQKKGASGPNEVWFFTNGECLCATRLSPDLHADFPDTPANANFTCEAQSEDDAPKERNGLN